MPRDNDREQASAANRLYWESDASVAEIAEKLGLSRRALYDAVHPRAAGAACPECGADLVFRTRTARMLGEAECPECGLERDIEALREATAEAGPAMRRRADAEEPEAAERPRAAEEPEAAEERPASPGAVPTEIEPWLRERAAWLGGAALAGVIIGAVAAWLSSRR